MTSDTIAEKVLSLGMIGFSPGNGHPFSFSAILNGYDGDRMRDAGWAVIADYLDRQDAADIGCAGARVTCCWADEPDIAKNLKDCCGIDQILAPADMLDAGLDGVVIARDDWESHARLAMPFLEAGLSVFVDKPLTLDKGELAAFEPYLQSGKLMSCSGLRYARELDMLRAGQEPIGKVQAIVGTVPLAMDRYGIHVLEAITGALGSGTEFTVIDGFCQDEESHAFLRTTQGAGVSVHALGPSIPRFRVSVFGDKGSVEVDIRDNFSAFRRCMMCFVDQVRTGAPAIPPRETLALMQTMIAIEGVLRES